MDFSNLTDCPYYLVSRVYLQMTSAFKKSFAAAGVGKVRPAYLGALICLWEKEGIKMAELGRCAKLGPSTMTGLLDRMERDGFVTRSADPDDRRAYLIHLTKQGREIKDTVLRMVDETLNRLMVGVSDEELENSNMVLRRILKNAAEKPNGA